MRSPGRVVVSLQNLVAGEWQPPGIELQHAIGNSNTGEELMQQRGSAPVQISTAIERAEQVHRNGDWHNLPRTERADTLNRIADALDGIVEDIASIDAMTTGVPIRYTRKLAKVCGAAFRGAAALASESPTRQREEKFEVERLPLGPAAIIAPWNAPAGIASHKLASALAAGCPVVFKPSEWAPLSGQLITEAVNGLDLPDGTFQLLHGDGMTGSALAGDPRIAAVSFTGGLAAGRAVAASCAHQVKPAQLELGGNNPLIVLSDADIDAAADGVVTALTTLNGQWCRALGRLIVHESLHDDLVDAALERLAGLTIGSSLDDASDMGPMVHELHRNHVESAVASYSDTGGTVRRAGSLPKLDGWFVQPTLITGIDGGNEMDEVFGPVATVHSFASDEEAVQLGNRAPYGLSAYVYGSAARAYDVARRIEAGTVKVNSVTLLSPHPEAPRPAWKLSGLGDEGARETFEFFRGSRVIGMPEGIPG